MGSTIARILFLILIPVSLSAQSVTSNFMLAGGPTGGAPTTVVDTVGADNEDGMAIGGASPAEALHQGGAADRIYTGGFVSPDDSAQVGFIFATSIPQGATVDSGFLYIGFGVIDSTNTFEMDIYGYDVDVAAVFNSAHTHTLRNHAALTSARIAWDGWRDTWDFTVQRSPDIKTIVQEIVDRVGYVANNKMGIIIIPDMTTQSPYNNALIKDFNSGTNPENYANIRLYYH